MNLRNLEQKGEQIVKSYQELLDFFSEERDWKSLCLQFAKQHPIEFNTISKLIINNNEIITIKIQKVTKIVEYINTHPEQKIQAIKLVREEYGFGLKESKNIVDSCCAYREYTNSNLTEKDFIQIKENYGL